MRTSMNPPPPILPAAGSTTANANAVATAASTAFPPFCRISTPVREANSSSVATMPWAPRTASFGQDFSVSARSMYSAVACARREKQQSNVATAQLALFQIVRIFMWLRKMFDLLAQEFNRVRAGDDTCLGTAGDEFLHSLFALFAAAERPLVHVHADKLVGEFGFHVARELHGVFQRVFAMFKRVLDAFANRPGNQTANIRAKRFAHSVAAERKRHSCLFMPPDAEIQNFVQTHLWIEKLPFVNQQSCIDKFVPHGVKNFVKRHDDRFEIRLVKFE